MYGYWLAYYIYGLQSGSYLRKKERKEGREGGQEKGESLPLARVEGEGR